MSDFRCGMSWTAESRCWLMRKVHMLRVLEVLPASDAPGHLQLSDASSTM
jgi:hypothetical protein